MQSLPDPKVTNAVSNCRGPQHLAMQRARVLLKQQEALGCFDPPPLPPPPKKRQESPSQPLPYSPVTALPGITGPGGVVSLPVVCSFLGALPWDQARACKPHKPPPPFRNSRKLPAAREHCRGSYSPWECGNVGEAQPDRGFLASWAAAKSGPGSTAAKGSPHKKHPAPEQSWTRTMPCAPPAAISSLFSYSRELPKLAQSSAVLPLFPSTPQLTDT